MLQLAVFTLMGLISLFTLMPQLTIRITCIDQGELPEREKLVES
jgi:hypothetical protein